MTTRTTHPTRLRADWVNSWLAALGTLRLLPDATLSWDGRGTPVARFETADQASLASRLAEALPTVGDLNGLVIARHRPDHLELPRNVDLHTFKSRAALARAAQGRDGTLDATLTDLGDPKREPISHAPFDPPMPKGITLWERAATCRALLPPGGTDLERMIGASLNGRGSRVQTNGLGFDVTRKAGGVHGAGVDVMVDPVIETLAFEGIQLFPFRGDGRHTRQRGFRAAPSRRRSFRWPAWSLQLDVWAFDAFFDIVARHLAALPLSAKVESDGRLVGNLQRLGVTALHGLVAQVPRSSQDTYRAYGAERLW